MPTRALGRTGETVSAIGLGGWHLALPHVDEPLSLRIVRSAIDNGITFMDNSWDYNDGQSELRMGKALRDGYRDQGVPDDEDRRPLEEGGRPAARRVPAPAGDRPHRPGAAPRDPPVRGPVSSSSTSDGANAALLEARQAGKIRYIGFTGHKDPRIHLHMLEVAEDYGFTFDTVQMPLNVMDAHYRSFEKLVLPELVKRRIGVLGMKPLANGIILRSGTVSATECLRYALHLPTDVVITGIDSMKVLEQALEVARTFRPLSEGEVTALLAKTADAALRGEYEPFKTSSIFDATAQHPEWLGEEPERLQRLMPA